MVGGYCRPDNRRRNLANLPAGVARSGQLLRIEAGEEPRVPVHRVGTVRGLHLATCPVAAAARGADDTNETAIAAVAAQLLDRAETGPDRRVVARARAAASVTTATSRPSPTRTSSIW